MKTKPSSKIIKSLRWGGTLITSALFIWLLWNQDWPTMWLTLRHMQFWIFPLAFGLYFLGVLFNALRWYMLLRAQQINVSFAEILKIVLVGNFASNFLPSTIGGDSVRILSAARFAGWGLSVASVVVDRVLNMIVMLTLMPISLGVVKAAGMLKVMQSAGKLAISGAALPALIEKIRRLAFHWLRQIYDAVMVWRNRPGTVLWAFTFSWAARMVVYYGVWVLGQELHIQASYMQVVAIGTITYVVSLLPISVNGLGLREVTMSAMYIQLGASIEQASTLVMLTRFILMIETLPGALWISEMLTQAKSKKS